MRKRQCSRLTSEVGIRKVQPTARPSVAIGPCSFVTQSRLPFRIRTKRTFIGKWFSLLTVELIERSRRFFFQNKPRI
jgi:hypothetical protein